MKTTPVRFIIMDVRCRHCGERIEVQPGQDLTPEEQLADCERQAEAKHVCLTPPSEVTP
jgi:hypothetical protein